MKRYISILAVAALALGGCSTAQYANVVSAIQTNTAGVASVATAAAAATCPVLPTIEQVSAGVAAANKASQSGAVVTSTAVAGVLCAALAPQPTATPIAPLTAPASGG